MYKLLLAVFLVLVLNIPPVFSIGQAKYVKTCYSNCDFILYCNGMAADIYVDSNDWAGVLKAVNDLKKDINRVAGMIPSVKNKISALQCHSIIVGTIGKSKIIDSLISSGKLNVSEVVGKWETFVIQVVQNPVPGVNTGLIIAGSDKRGTIYGIYDLSEQIGVSPWYWWADVTPQPTTTIIVENGTYKQGPPSVKYRGIFINDEANLRDWCYYTNEPGTKPGPETYKKIFELLLRLKANFIWAAMHGGADYFNKYPETAQKADEWGIIQSSSHCDMMTRNNTNEWDSSYGNGEYDWTINEAGLRQYWEEAVQRGASYEIGWSMGMRGIHDSRVPNAAGWNDVVLTETIITAQREMLQNHVNSDVSKVFQVFCPYKEYLDIYNDGLYLPDDITILWAEDNHGYLRQVPNASEQVRQGGNGVYYHLSYYGSPKSYLWLNSTPPSLIWEEMTKAYQTNQDRLWVVNVGDIKPVEIGMEFFLNYGWNKNYWNESNVIDFIKSFAEREFGSAYKDEIADIMMNYYQLSIARRPEFMTKGIRFNHLNYGDEAEKRVYKYHSLVVRAQNIYDSLPLSLRDAFFELVLYPVRGAYFTNARMIYADKSDLFKSEGRGASVNTIADKAMAAHDLLYSDVDYFNTFLNGKWNYIMDPSGKATSGGANIPSIPGKPKVSSTMVSGSPDLKVVSEGSGSYNFINSDTYVNCSGFSNINNLWNGSTSAGANDTNATGTTAAWVEFDFGSVQNITKARIYEDHHYSQITDWKVMQFNGSSWVDIFAYTEASAKGWHERTFNVSTSKIRLYARCNISGRFVSIHEFECISDFAVADLNFSHYTSDIRFIDVINSGGSTLDWTASANRSWVELNRTEGSTASHERIWASIDWSNVAEGNQSGVITITGAGSKKNIVITVSKPSYPAKNELEGYVEANGYVAIEAENYFKKINRSQSQWKVVDWLGRNGGSVCLFPAGAKSITSNISTASPELQYKIFFFTTGTFPVTIYRIPTLNTTGGVSYAMALDSSTPRIITGTTREYTNNWHKNVTEQIERRTVNITVSSAGYHILRLWMVDPSVAIDRIVINTGGEKPSYLGPPESYNSINPPAPDTIPQDLPAIQKMPDPTPVPVTSTLVIEAESASDQLDFSPFTIQSDSSASAGEYIVVTNGAGNSNLSSVTENGGIIYGFNLSQPSSVTVKLRALLPTAKDDSFWYRLNSGTWLQQNNNQYSDWTWMKLTTYQNIPAGNHTISIINREDGAQIDQIKLEVYAGQITSIQPPVTSIK